MALLECKNSHMSFVIQTCKKNTHTHAALSAKTKYIEKYRMTSSIGKQADFWWIFFFNTSNMYMHSKIIFHSSVLVFIVGVEILFGLTQNNCVTFIYC